MTGAGFERMVSDLTRLRITRNPKPPGAMLPGRTTLVVYEWLCEQDPSQWWAEWHIRRHVKRGHGVVSWSLLRLRELGMIECRPDWNHSRYLLYRGRRP